MKRLIKSFLLIILTIYTQAQNFPNTETDGKYYNVNGARLWVVSFANGEPIFFIPGGSGNAHT